MKCVYCICALVFNRGMATICEYVFLFVCFNSAVLNWWVVTQKWAFSDSIMDSRKNDSKWDNKRCVCRNYCDYEILTFKKHSRLHRTHNYNL